MVSYIVLHTLCVDTPPLLSLSLSLSLSLTHSHRCLSLSPFLFSPRAQCFGVQKHSIRILRPSWVGSTASKSSMFDGVKRGSIASSTVCVCAGATGTRSSASVAPSASTTIETSVGVRPRPAAKTVSVGDIRTRLDKHHASSALQGPLRSGTNIMQAVPCWFYSDESAQTSCKQCAAGNYSDDLGQTLCKQCAEGQYLDEVAQTSCKTCKRAHIRTSWTNIMQAVRCWELL